MFRARSLFFSSVELCLFLGNVSPACVMGWCAYSTEKPKSPHSEPVPQGAGNARSASVHHNQPRCPQIVCSPSIAQHCALWDTLLAAQSSSRQRKLTREVSAEGNGAGGSEAGSQSWIFLPCWVKKHWEKLHIFLCCLGSRTGKGTKGFPEEVKLDHPRLPIIRWNLVLFDPCTWLKHPLFDHVNILQAKQWYSF